MCANTFNVVSLERNFLLTIKQICSIKLIVDRDERCDGGDCMVCTTRDHHGNSLFTADGRSARSCFL